MRLKNLGMCVAISATGRAGLPTGLSESLLAAMPEHQYRT
jgi:hypothetical protein